MADPALQKGSRCGGGRRSEPLCLVYPASSILLYLGGCKKKGERQERQCFRQLGRFKKVTDVYSANVAPPCLIIWFT